MNENRAKGSGVTSRNASQHAVMRRRNESALLQLLQRNDGLPSALLSRQSGLAPQTVSVLLRRLEEKGLVRRGEVLRGKRGQPAVPIHLVPEAAFSVGIAIDWHRIGAVVLDFSGRVHRAFETVYEHPHPDTIVEQVIALALKCKESLSDSNRRRLVGVTVAIPSNLRLTAKFLRVDEELMAQLGAVDGAKDIEKATGLQFNRINDGHAAASAELAFGRAVPDRDISYLHISTMIRGGIVLEGRVLKGRTGVAGRLGSHIARTRDNEYKSLHVVASTLALENEILRQGHQLPEGPIAEWDFSELSGPLDVWIEDAARALAVAVANTASIMELGYSIIDGDLPRPIIARLVTKVQERLGMPPFSEGYTPMVLIGSLGKDAAAIGAAYQPIASRFFS